MERLNVPDHSKRFENDLLTRIEAVTVPQVRPECRERQLDEKRAETLHIGKHLTGGIPRSTAPDYVSILVMTVVIRDAP